MSRAIPGAGTLGRSMPHGTVLLVCLDGEHEHYVGDIQAARIQRTPCCWCRSPLYVAAWWEGSELVTAMPPIDPREEGLQG